MNKNNRQWLEVRNQGSEALPAEIVVSGPIGDSFWDDTATSAKQFREALNGIPRGRKIDLKINSEGGVIKDGLDMYDAVRARRDDITAHVIGYGCSTSSWFFLPAGKVVTADNALWMIHKSSAMTYGNEEEHAKQVAALKKHDESIAGMLAQKTGKSVATIMDAMSKETWFTGKEAKEYGLADEVFSEASNVLNDATIPGAIRVRGFAGDKEHVRNQIKEFSAAGQGTKTNAAPASPTAGEQGPPPAAPAAQISAPTNEGGKASGSAAEARPTPTKEQHMDKNTPAAVMPPADNNAEVTNRLTDALTRLDAAEQKIKVLEAPPINAPRIAVIGDAHDKLIELPQGRDRHRHLVNAWSDIKETMRRKTGKDGNDAFQAFNGQIVNSNTISATLTTALLSSTSYTILQNKLAALQAIFLQVVADKLKPKAKVEVPKTTAGPTAQTNPTDWESGDGTVTNTELTMAEYSASINISSADLQNGSRMEWLTFITAQSFANKIIDVLLTPVTVAIYGNPVLTAAAAAFGVGDLPTILASAKDFHQKNLVLDGAYTARLTPTSTLGLSWANGSSGFGFDKIVEHNRWSAAGANVVGFVADPLSLVAAAALPIEPPGSNAAFNSLDTAVIPQINFPVQMASWVKPGTRVLWMAYDALFAVQQGDTAGLKPITSA